MSLKIQTAPDFEKFLEGNHNQLVRQIKEACTILSCTPKDTVTLILDLSGLNARTLYAMFMYAPHVEGNAALLFEKITAFAQSQEMAERVLTQTMPFRVVLITLLTLGLKPTYDKLETIQLPNEASWCLAFANQKVFAGIVSETPIIDPLDIVGQIFTSGTPSRGQA